MVVEKLMVISKSVNLCGVFAYPLSLIAPKWPKGTLIVALHPVFVSARLHSVLVSFTIRCYRFLFKSVVTLGLKG